ncbi:MAG: glycosyltransferase [Candidatus Moraniibacteriota bacterium]
MKKVQTYIITPTWNNADYTIRCFDSIAKHTKDYCIVWVDNASEKEDREIVQNFLNDNNIPHIAILNDENLGFVQGTNQGLEKFLENVDVDYAIFQNNDTEVTESWLERYIEIAESDPEIGLVGPLTSPCDSWQSVERLQGKMSIFENLPDYNDDFESYAKIINKQYSGMTYQVGDGILAFFSTLLKREVIEQVGMLSEEYGVGFRDDDDYAERSRKFGWKLVLACDVFIFHNHRTTFKKRYTEDEIEEMMEENMKTFRKKHRGIYFKLGKMDTDYFLTLSRKGWRTFRQQGIKKFISDIKNFIVHGREYFK